MIIVNQMRTILNAIPKARWSEILRNNTKKYKISDAEYLLLATTNVNSIPVIVNE